MNLGFRFNTLAMLTVFFGLITFCLADERAGLALASAVICLAGYFAGAAGNGWRPLCLPRFVVNLLVLGAIINAAFHASRAGAGQPIVSHLGEFLVYVQLLKLFDRRTSRDESQLLTLSLFVVIAAMLTSNTLPVGVCLVIYTPLALSTCMLYQLRAGQRRASPDLAIPIDASAPRQIQPTVFQGRRSTVQFRGVAISSLLLASVLAAVVFAITPRGLGAGALGRFGEARVTQTGFNDQITLGRSGFLQDSAVPVLDMAVEDSNGGNLGSPDRIYYLRGVTRDQYGGRIWTSSARRGDRDSVSISVDANAARPLERVRDKEPPRTARLIQRITLRGPARENSVLFTVWRPYSVSSAQPISIDVDSTDLALRRNGSTASELTYVIQSSQADSGGLELPEIPTAFGSGRIRDLAASVLQQAGVAVDPEARDRAANRLAAAAFRDYLQSNFQYSRELIAPGEGQDPIEMFLFETKQGHCEYYASAMVAMCQSVGLSARLVVGYVAADFNTVTRKYMVRQSDAHAWVEIHAGNGAWQTFDPTPADGVSALQRQSQGWLASLRNWYDTIEFGWNRSVIGFDASSQRSSAVGRRFDFERLSRFFDDVSGRLFVSARKLQAGQRPAFPSAWLFPALLSMAAIGALVFFRRKHRSRPRSPIRARRRGTARANIRSADTGFYRVALRILGKTGAPKPESVPPLSHAEHLADLDHPASGPLAVIAAAYYKIRFGGCTLSAQELAEANRQVAELRGAAARKRRGQS